MRRQNSEIQMKGNKTARKVESEEEAADRGQMEGSEKYIVIISFNEKT